MSKIAAKTTERESHSKKGLDKSSMKTSILKGWKPEGTSLRLAAGILFIFISSNHGKISIFFPTNYDDSAGPSQGLKIRGARSTVVGIICPPG